MSEWYFMEGNNNADKLRKIMVEHPNLPIIFAYPTENPLDYCGSVFTDEMKVEVGEVFNSDEWGDDYVYTDRDDLEDRIREDYYDDYYAKQRETMTEDEFAEQKLKEAEKHWTECIFVYVG